MRDEEFYMSAGKSFQQKILANMDVIASNNRKMANPKLGWYERKNLEADNISRNKAIKVLKLCYSNRLAAMKYEAPELLRALRAGFEN